MRRKCKSSYKHSPSIGLNMSIVDELQFYEVVGWGVAVWLMSLTSITDMTSSTFNRGHTNFLLQWI